MMTCMCSLRWKGEMRGGFRDGLEVEPTGEKKQAFAQPLVSTHRLEHQCVSTASFCFGFAVSRLPRNARLPCFAPCNQELALDLRSPILRTADGICSL